MSESARRPWAIFYEHPDWFRPLFRELERRGHRYAALHPEELSFDIGGGEIPYPLVFNRMSASAYLRGGRDRIFYTLNLLEHLERRGARIVNGLQAFRVEISKALQLQLIDELGLPCPRTRVVAAADSVFEAARPLRFPLVVKPNVGGRGAGIRRFDSEQELEAAAVQGLDAAIDATLLVQEYIEAARGCITRVEVLGGRLLYAIRVQTRGCGFNLCPAEIDTRQVSAAGAAGTAPRVEAVTPPGEVIEEVLRITAAAGIEVGGVEYIEDARGRRYYYDINSLSNFVADPERVVGFDPVPLLVNYLEKVAG